MNLKFHMIAVESNNDSQHLVGVCHFQTPSASHLILYGAQNTCIVPKK